MKNILMTASAMSLIAGGAVAGGVERSTQSVAILFEKGTYAELSFGSVSPDVSGTVGAGTVSSGNMSADYFTYSLGYKQALSDNLDVAIILDQPIGADVDYPAGTGYPAQGSVATLKSTALTGLVRYRLPSNVSVYGGLRAQSVQGDVSIPFVASYALSTDTSYDFGYVLGVAWERPDIAARVALTYNSAITHTLEGTERSLLTGGANVATSFDTEVPQSLNLEFQTGIAADTLLFGSIRWVEWSAFNINPPGYPPTTPIVSYAEDRITYTLGVGRKFSEAWSGAVTLSHEPSDGQITGNLGPTDGFTSIGLGATYTTGNMKITGGVRYVDVGDATTATLNGNFTDNSALGVGIKVGFTF